MTAVLGGRFLKERFSLCWPNAVGTEGIGAQEKQLQESHAKQAIDILPARLPDEQGRDKQNKEIVKFLALDIGPKEDKTLTAANLWLASTCRIPDDKRLCQAENKK
ncbi:hypothetical protein ACVRXQ_11890 [Streptococcus panodentis]|uniref:hypothetical protein n=1 Tax=Streptococcus panodentis TaxID=1581472 RepID=UPI001AE5D32C|nr:hypothetical protein [Streptococcus panodentis]